MLLAASGCSGSEPACTPRASTPLVSADSWQLTLAGEDPFTDRPALTDCVPEAVVVEGQAVEVSTRVCSYATLVQPLETDVHACETFRATIAHFPLFAAGPADAHLALRIGDETVWERVIPIPADAAVYSIEHAGPIPAGTPLYFHLHNHGANDYYLADVRTGS